jgi:hypothetical protein
MKAVKLRDLPHLFVVAASIVFIWIVFGIFNSFEFNRRTIETGNIQPWTEPAMFQQTSSMIWALFTPLVIFIAERLPIRKPNRIRNALILLALTPGLAVIRAAIGGIINDLAEGRTPRIAFAIYSVSIRFHRNAFFILIIIGVTNLILAQRAAAMRERNALALRTAVSNAELQRLRASMQPRLMFATLDAIAAKVMTAPHWSFTDGRSEVSSGSSSVMTSQTAFLPSTRSKKHARDCNRHSAPTRTSTGTRSRRAW